ncbi:interleukin-1 receptor-associated kinase 4 [Rhinophrynus dorsalis]
MSKEVTPSTYVRNLSHGLHRQLADFLDPQEGWKKIATDIQNCSGGPRYSQFHIRRFEETIKMGKSPTCELLYDWGTTNCTVGDLRDLLVRNDFLAAASHLLPDLNAGSMATMRVDDKYKPIPTPVQTPVRANEVEHHCPVQSSNQEENDNEPGFAIFSFNELKRITRNFDDQPVSEGGNKLGEGGFGIVFQGELKGKTVAVKKLTELFDTSIDDLKHEFYQEIQTMAKCQHENLVKLLGFSNDGDHHCLVYMYMPNGSLLDRLACLNNTTPLSWLMRCNIAHGTANGIRYLHQNNHVHRDIKSANILLDEAFVPKISDFGLARTTGQFAKTMMTERIVGTTAYMAPEALRGEVTIKSDIFSFGVVLLEIISGLAPVDDDRIPPLLLDIVEEIEEEEKTLDEYTDKKMGDVNSDTLEDMYKIASKCLHQMKNKRPDITKVLQLLDTIKNTLAIS